MRSGKHSNKALQKDFDAYKRFFRFEVLEYCDYSNLSAREDYWCNHFEVWKNGYNHQTTGDNRHYAREKDSRNKEGFKSKI